MKERKDVSRETKEVNEMTIKQQYRKERNRILSTINRYKKAGYDVNLEVPKIPKKITKGSVRRLQKIDVRTIRSKSEYVDIDTGEILNYEVAKRKRRKNVSRETKTEIYIPTESELALSRINEIIEDYPDRSRDLFKTKLASAISIYGSEKVGNIISDMISAGEIVAPSEAYNYQLLIEMSNDLMRRLDFNEREINEVMEDIFNESSAVEEFEGDFDTWT